MQKDTLHALIAYYTEKHHRAEEDFANAKTGERAEFYLYLKTSYERELRKLQKLSGGPR